MHERTGSHTAGRTIRAFHSVLPYSNWEWGRVVQSESLLSIRLGLQSALLKLRDVPQANHRRRHHKLGSGRKNPSERGYQEPAL
ncbi:MAG: hypothetical protein IPJ46_09065 [Anaerolineales bacterium]|nr:hypothetical protein [Anaerolineales bacterium]